MALKRKVRLFPKIFNMLKYILKNLNSRSILNNSLRFRKFQPQGRITWQISARAEIFLWNLLFKEKNKTKRTELCGILIHFDQFRKEILFKKLWISSFIYLFFFSWNVRWQKPTVKISVNQKTMNGISESLQWSFREIQGVNTMLPFIHLHFVLHYLIFNMSAHALSSASP